MLGKRAFQAEGIESRKVLRWQVWNIQGAQSKQEQTEWRAVRREGINSSKYGQRPELTGHGKQPETS